MTKNGLPELLAPAGSPEALTAAIEAGADAVYFGTTMFNARMSAKNFTREATSEALKRCHDAGVKAYVTMNTLLYDKQYKDALSQAEFLYESGADALIVADFGLADILSRYLPDFPLHASTQCSGHNSDAAQYLYERGFSLMVAARELSRDNLIELIKKSPIKIEVFIHGAFCVSASGQCLMSSFVGGRSGNRGECAQPCRLPYNGKYPLSLKDNCLASHISELIDMGAASLKIEGRMKSPDYVRSVVSVYRKLLDEKRDATAKEIGYLASVFSRDGFTDGYFTGKLVSMNGVRSEADKTASAVQRLLYATKPVKKEPIVIPERNNKIPDSVFEKIPRSENAPGMSARFYDPSSIPDVNDFEIIYLPLEKYDPKKANGVIMPPVITDKERETVKKKLFDAKRRGAVHLLVGNIGHIALARETGMKLHGDFRFNITSTYSERAVESYFEDVILSPELTVPQIRDIGGKKSVVVYGRMPLMLLEKSLGCNKLTDRRRVDFPVIKEGGRDIILNSVPIYMADKKDELKKAMPFGMHFIFTTEGPQEVRYIINNYKKGLPTKKEIRRIR